MPAKPPNPIDVHVGRRIRIRRIQIDMSQQVLGNRLHLTFQQIQKYEKGTNRIGASRLQEIGKVLEVPAAYFFDGAPGGWEPAGAETTANTFVDFLATREGQSLAAAFSRIPDVGLRRSVVDLVERLAAIADNSPATRGRSRLKRK
jgi:transcriptional regulator with XRE-family HTH domain